MFKRKSNKESKKANVPTDNNGSHVPKDSNKSVVSGESKYRQKPTEIPVQTESNRQRDMKDELMVCAIDIGTTYSGYAYSMRSDPMKIYCPHWTSGTSTLASHKIPTTVLLDKNKKIVAFGYEAEKLYSEFVQEKEADDHFFFRRFKMVLHEITTKKVCTRLCPIHFRPTVLQSECIRHKCNMNSSDLRLFILLDNRSNYICTVLYIYIVSKGERSENKNYLFMYS